MLDFNQIEGTNDGLQKRGYIVPKDSIVPVAVKLNPSAYGIPGENYIMAAKSGLRRISLMIEVVEGSYKGCHWFETITLPPFDQNIQMTPGQKKAAQIGGQTLKALVCSGRRVSMFDQSTEANNKRKLNSWADLEGMKFWAQVSYTDPDAKGRVFNCIKHIVDKNEPDYQKLMKCMEVITNEAVPAPVVQQQENAAKSSVYGGNSQPDFSTEEDENFPF